MIVTIMVTVNTNTTSKDGGSGDRKEGKGIRNIRRTGIG
jgi:hypothetical protein